MPRVHRLERFRAVPQSRKPPTQGDTHVRVHSRDGIGTQPEQQTTRFSTDAVEGALPDKQVSKHLGQGSIEHTYRYIHLTEDGVEREFQQSMKKIDQQSARTPKHWPAPGQVKGS